MNQKPVTWVSGRTFQKENSKYKVPKQQHTMGMRPKCWIEVDMKGQLGMTLGGSRGSGHVEF